MWLSKAVLSSNGWNLFASFTYTVEFSNVYFIVTSISVNIFCNVFVPMDLFLECLLWTFLLKHRRKGLFTSFLYGFVFPIRNIRSSQKIFWEIRIKFAIFSVCKILHNNEIRLKLFLPRVNGVKIVFRLKPRA